MHFREKVLFPLLLLRGFFVVDSIQSSYSFASKKCVRKTFAHDPPGHRLKPFSRRYNFFVSVRPCWIVLFLAIASVVRAEYNVVFGILTSPSTLSRWGDHVGDPVGDPARVDESCESYFFRCVVVSPRSSLLCANLDVSYPAVGLSFLRGLVSFLAQTPYLHSVPIAFSTFSLPICLSYSLMTGPDSIVESFLMPSCIFLTVLLAQALLTDIGFSTSLLFLPLLLFSLSRICSFCQLYDVLTSLGKFLDCCSDSNLQDPQGFEMIRMSGLLILLHTLGALVFVSGY